MKALFLAGALMLSAVPALAVDYTITLNATQDAGVTAQRLEHNAACGVAPQAASCTTYANNTDFITYYAGRIATRWGRQNIVEKIRSALDRCRSTGDCTDAITAGAAIP